MNDEMNMNDFNDEVTDEVTLDVADEPQIIDLTEPNDILADEDAAPVTNPWRRPGQWFVVHTQAGYEKKVKANLEARIQSLNIEDRIYETVIPMEDVVEFKNGRKQTVQKKVFPGYILVRCIMDDESWYCIRNTPGITGFVGQSQKGQKPTPLSRFADFSGQVAEINADHMKLKVLVNIFGRETMVEMDFSQVAKL